MPEFTPDKRYLIVNGVLWRTSNPHLPEERRAELVKYLMGARRAVKGALAAKDEEALRTARRKVHKAKIELGERGPVWWDDGVPDYNRKRMVNTPYRQTREA